MENILVSDIMTRHPKPISPDTNILKCAKIMLKEKRNALLLAEKKKLRGIISIRDVLWACIKRPKEELANVKAIEISPRKIATVRPSRSVAFAYDKMKKTKISRLPVIQKGELVGIITIRDILNFNPHLFPELTEYHQIREESEKVKRLKNIKTQVFREGICEECGNVAFLTSFNGMIVCDSCRDSR